jgi:hypothetical protein
MKAKDSTNYDLGEIERENKYLLANPELYQIGIKKECFSYWLLAKHIVYALWHAFVIFMACLIAISSLGAHQTTGKDIDFWLGGFTIYMVCVFVANLILAQHSMTFEWRYIFLLVLGPLSLFFFYWIGNILLVSEISYIFANNLTITVIWYAIIFSLVSTYLLDTVRQIYENFDEIEDNMLGKK